MIKLRNYLDSDAKEILKWVKDERALRLWSADRYGAYPITPEDITNNYKECMADGLFCPMTLVDDDKIIGHIILRNPSPEKKETIRLGFIIVDSSLRGKGYGKLLIQEAINYAKKQLSAKEIDLAVFANNDSAYHCYQAVGFKEVDRRENVFQFKDENWGTIKMVLQD